MKKSSLLTLSAGALLSLTFLSTWCIAEQTILFTALIPGSLSMEILAPKEPIEEKIAFYPGEVIHHKILLPEDFKVHYHTKFGISREPMEQSTEKTIPTKNEYAQAPGCYIACFSEHKPKEGVYVVGANQHMIGQIRVKGMYSGKQCIPEGFANQDLRIAEELKEKCQAHFPTHCEKGNCRAGGYTGHWFF